MISLLQGFGGTDLSVSGEFFPCPLLSLVMVDYWTFNPELTGNNPMSVRQRRTDIFANNLSIQD